MSGLLDRLRPKTEASESGEWVLTFADLMTLLFCFFVLLTFLSTAPKNCTGLAKYFEQNRGLYRNFELRNSKLECVISLPSDFLFRSGGDRVQPAALTRLRPLFQEVKRLEEHATDLIIVEGHTDNVPIRTRRFPSNWELSSARATNVSTFLRRIGMSEERMSVRAYAEQRPRVPYVDDFGKKLRGRQLRDARKKNRRVDIIFVNPPTKIEEFGILFK
ncbi:MAG: OmpA family protein [SAR324 cluster bacterium]|nr:OmpA family protein [SAR324 cluster bacterium]MCZ6533424.1 OmpA family protein [SAR324 cluster bacterium]MCZ6629690.1 OmpA family protein [SAR324 cluster bacterium]